MRYGKQLLRLCGAICWIGISFAVILASLASLQARNNNSPVRSSYSATELVALLGRSPITVDFDRMAIDLPCDREELSRYISCVSATGPSEAGSPSRSRNFHTGRLVAISGGTPEWIVIRESISSEVRTYTGHVNLDAEGFLLTWRGPEAVTMANGDRSEHRDQTLSALADLGLKLNSTIETRNGDFPVSALLATSINEFHVGQEEISWTVSAYASYLPPQTVWWNRYGEEYSFDTVVKEMMASKLNRESCRGLHLVMALTKVLRIDRIRTILAPEARKALNAYVRGKLAEAVESQLEDGSWPLLWSRSGFSDVVEFTPEDSIVNRILVTGHMLEWFHMLPRDIKPPVDTVRTGSLWILDNLRSVSRETVNKHFCPYTHAVLSLYLARFLE